MKTMKKRNCSSAAAAAEKVDLHRSCSSAAAAEKVASMDDMMIEILLYLPASSLLGFTSVSKHWLSLITSPLFSRLHHFSRPTPIQPFGLFIHISNREREGGHQTHPQYKYRYRYIPLNNNSTGEQPPSRTIITFPSPDAPGGSMRILQSCNGLLFCSTCSSYGLYEYYIHNPTTRKFTTIPLPPRQLTPVPRRRRRRLDNMLTNSTTLAFDPSRSPHYKLVFVHNHESDTNYECNNSYQIVVYSSETRLWSVCGDQPLKNPYLTNFSNGVYLNGAVHWMSKNRTSIYLKIDEERIETMSMPQIPNHHNYLYFGESGGRLHLIDHCDSCIDVYEMEKDCSKWCLRYQVDLRRVLAEIERIGIVCSKWCLRYQRVLGEIEIIGIVRGEREEDSFLVLKTLHRDGFFRFIKYKFADKTFKMLFEIVAIRGRGAHPIGIHDVINDIYHRSGVFEFIQSLSHV